MKEKIIRLLKTKGYYMVLALCVLTVGTVSFLSYRSSQKKKAAEPITRAPEETQVEKVEENVKEETPRDPVQDNTPAQESTEAPQAIKAEYSAPLKGEIIGHFSPDEPVYSYTLKDWRTHAGIDIAAEAGAEIRNVCAGKVEETGTDDLLGNFVLVRHTDGKVSRYASLDQITVTAGQVLNKGDVIGTVGTSMLLECGEAAHLHYELRADGNPVEPSFLFN